MTEKEAEMLQKRMSLYYSKNPLTRKLFRDRVKDAISLSEIQNNSVILDVGCNTGFLLESIRDTNSSCQCWGVDIDPAVMNVQIQNCRFKTADIRKLPFDDNYFDIVFALDILEHVQDIQDAIQEIKRVLKPGGVLILSGPTESLFYHLCRYLQFGVAQKNVKCTKPGFGDELDHHYHTVYELEDALQMMKFKKIKQKVLPGKPLPALFRVTKFRN